METNRAIKDKLIEIVSQNEDPKYLVIAHIDCKNKECEFNDGLSACMAKTDIVISLYKDNTYVCRNFKIATIFNIKA